MNKLKIKIENCYGIKKLEHEFDFSSKRVYAIYAPNGLMKTSLAKTFGDVAGARPSGDLVFPERKSKREIVDETDKEIGPEAVFVVEPQKWEFSSPKMSTLLANKSLRDRHAKVYADIDEKKEMLLRGLRKSSGLRSGIEDQIGEAFTGDAKSFLIALGRVKDEVNDGKPSEFSDIVYSEIFSQKVLDFLEKKDVKTSIAEYIDKYNELLNASTYFSKGVFNHYNAATIAKALDSNGFFEAKHTVSLNAAEKKEISTKADLEKVIEEEKSAIMKNADLVKKYNAFAKSIEGNQELRDFQEFLSKNPKVLPELGKLSNFKQKLWISYFKDNKDSFNGLFETYQAGEKALKEISEEAKKEITQWEKVIEIFNSRFHVPFRLEAVNKIEAVLGTTEVLTLGYRFKDNADEKKIDQQSLVRVLSNGELRAHYILNVIFEVEARIHASQKTIFIIDDIADSFDYKNKYAIIEYLRDIRDHDNFRELILTHNFDFFRTVCDRFNMYPQCLMAFRTNDGVRLEKATGIKNVFVNDWKQNLATDMKKLIASIAFVRNIVEYTKGESDPDFVSLTSLLHVKPGTDAFDLYQFGQIYQRVFSQALVFQNPQKRILEIITEEAQACLAAPEGVNFENKIVLSIAARMAAERYMIVKISDATFVAAIASNQTTALFAEFKRKFPRLVDEARLIDKVILMTPENIHVNSFMYEPILDMSDERLKKLYSDVTALI